MLIGTPKSTSAAEGAALPAIVTPKPLVCQAGSMLALYAFVGIGPTPQSAAELAVGDLDQ